ncbi:MAG: PEP-CTERM sorting domain-containing protein [Methanoregulaceae archaeon]|nr:PEP-CTERM sorting domain-containing protein [Methanoregulaceae archaeon]
MKKLLAIGIALGSLGSAHAALNFNLNTNYEVATIPNSGSIQVTFFGTVDVLLPTWDVHTASAEWPGLSPSGPFLAALFDSAFVTYVNGFNPGVDYSGAILSVTVNSTDLAGDYFYHSTTPDQLSEIVVFATDGANVAGDNEYYGVTLNPVPEPGTMVALGLGVAALARRRARRNV